MNAMTKYNEEQMEAQIQTLLEIIKQLGEALKKQNEALNLLNEQLNSLKNMTQFLGESHGKLLDILSGKKPQ
jgi:small-conductance mechanosensitive channel